jgi:hypothetical protein
VRNPHLLAVSAEATRAIAHEQGRRQVGGRERDVRRGRACVRSELLPVRRMADVRVVPLAEVQFDRIRVSGGIEVEIVATFAQCASGVDRDAAIAR